LDVFITKMGKKKREAKTENRHKRANKNHSSAKVVEA
jgi:hypothetical protein